MFAIRRFEMWRKNDLRLKLKIWLSDSIQFFLLKMQL